MAERAGGDSITGCCFDCHISGTPANISLSAAAACVRACVFALSARAQSSHGSTACGRAESGPRASLAENWRINDRTPIAEATPESVFFVLPASWERMG